MCYSTVSHCSLTGEGKFTFIMLTRYYPTQLNECDIKSFKRTKSAEQFH
uniref:Uncharacterized protein n=1 Tax=Anguilla anguilla TaxID=7936 RepID=A0A0E9V3P1_ANGAN